MIRIIKNSFCVATSIIVVIFLTSSDKIDKWKSYSGDPIIEHKVDSVLSLMTLEEKIGQMNQYSGRFAIATGEVKANNSTQHFKNGMIGTTFNIYGAEYIRGLQKENMKNSRLGIPMIFAGDVIHGLYTTFPIPLAEACSWDMEIIEATARAAAEEATASGVAWNFAPMVDISRDPRWGRVMEGAGEDSYLGSLIARARVRGFQGIEDYSDLSKSNTMVACAKHFVAYGAALAGRDYNSVDMSDHTLREIYFPPFQAAVDEGIGSFMTSFNDLNGIPCTGNKYIYKDVLRDEWGFGGMVVTDHLAIDQLVPHGYAKDLKDAARLTLNAGIDIDMVSEAYISYLKELVEEGKVSETQIDVAVSRILEMKFLLGLFDDPYKYCDVKKEKEVVLCDEFKELALKAAKSSIVLLKNSNNILPLSKSDTKKVALIGPFIDERMSLNGGWAMKGDRTKSVTLREGLEREFKDSNIEFKYAVGTILPEVSNKTRRIVTSDINKEQRFTEALNIAKQSDIILVAMGENQHMSGEAASRSDITLPGEQRELLKELKKAGKPIILVLFNGRPLDLSWEDENVDAIVEAWYLGLESGNAVASVLSGSYNPSGKLVMTFPRSVGQVPIYYNHLNTGRPFNDDAPIDYRSSYMDVRNTPLYPFGHGLSFSEFEYSNFKLDKNSFSKGESITFSIDVKNISDVKGEEVVQLYIQDKVGSLCRPVKELKGFKKISLNAGKSTTVKFTIDAKTIEYLGAEGKVIVEPGEFNLWIGTSSSDETNHTVFIYE